MTFSRPTLAEIIARVRNDFAQRLGETLTPLTVEDVLARSVGALSHGLHGHLAWIADQLFPDTAEDEGVLRWGGILGLPLLPSSTATGTATFDTTGAGIGAGTRARTDDGQEYEVRLPAADNGAGVVQVFLDAVEPGAAGNQALDTPLTLTAPIAGVTSVGRIGTMSGGADAETVEQFRVRILRRLARPFAGGAEGDYVTLALEVPGVARAWERQAAVGNVQLYVVDGIAGGSDLLEPSPARLDEVRAYVEARTHLTVPLTVLAPTFSPQTITLSSLTPNTAEVRDAITAELKSLFARDAAVPFPATGPAAPADAPDGRILVSRIREAISAAAGEQDHVLSSPTADIAAPADGELLTFGSLVTP